MLICFILRVVGQNLQQLEVSEEKALQREENYQNQIKNLTDSLKVNDKLLLFLNVAIKGFSFKGAENREENAIMNIHRRNIRIDQVKRSFFAKIKLPRYFYFSG